MKLRRHFHYVTLLLIFVAGWMLMVVAMMLPGTLPLITQVRRGAKRTGPAVLMVSGYVGVWKIFGGMAHMGDALVHEATHRFAWLVTNEWLLSVALLVLAGVYQFTPFKRICLTACRAAAEPSPSQHAARLQSNCDFVRRGCAMKWKRPTLAAKRFSFLARRMRGPRLVRFAQLPIQLACETTLHGEVSCWAGRQ